MNWFRHRLPVVSILALSFSVTYLLWQHEQRNATLDRQAKFDYELRADSTRIEQSMASYEHVLRGVQGLFAASGRVGREEFRAYVDALQLDANFAGIESFGVLLIVPHVEKERHMATIRAQGLPEYTIKPEGTRDVYAPVIQIEPFAERKVGEFGLDAYSDPLRRRAMDQARDSGAPAITGKTKLALDTETEARPGFVMYLPLYEKDAARDTITARRANIIGWVAAAFRTSSLMASLYGARASMTDIRIFDGVEMSEQTLMYDSAERRDDRRKARIEATEYIQVAGRTWTLAIGAQPGFAVPLGKDSSRLIAIGGTGLSLLLTLLTWVLSTARGRAAALARDMTGELREAKDHFELIFNASPDGALITRIDNGCVINMNDGFAALTGYSGGEVIGKTVDELDLWANPDERRRYAEQLAATGSCENLEALFHRKDGSEFAGIVSAKLANLNGVQCSVGVIRDITERKAVEERVRRMAQFDPLTNLPNRALCDDRLRQALAEAKRDKKHLALMFLDLDHFKPINDTLGHHVGDLLLKAVAKRIQDCLRESDTVARIGGDEFLVLLPSIEQEQDAIEVAEKIRHSINQPFELAGDHSLSISSSTGIAVFPEHGSDEMQLMRNADEAMYRAKEAGRNKVQLFVVDSYSSETRSSDQDASIVRLYWDPSYECGDAATDREHRELFELANTLIGAAFTRDEDPDRFDAIFAKLLAHTVQHFSAEETMLAQFGYEALDVHARAHRKLLERALELRDAAAAGNVTIGDLVNFLADELVARHILKVDRKYHPLTKKRTNPSPIEST